MLAIVLFSLVLTVYVVKFVRGRVKESYAPALPPVLPGKLPIIGHTHYFNTDTKGLQNFIQTLADYGNKVEGVFYFILGGKIHYVITDPDDAMTVANTCLQKHYFYDFIKGLGQGLLTGSGEVHKRHRKLLRPFHSVPAVHTYLELFNIQAKKLVTEMDVHSSKGPFDPSALFKNIGFETSRLTTFGLSMKCNDVVKNHLVAVEEIMHLLIHRMQTFYLHHDFCYKLFGQSQKENDLSKKIQRLSTKVIQQKKAAMKNGNNVVKSEFVSNEELPFKSFVDNLIELSMDGLLTDDEIREETDTNILAAFETTLYTLLHMTVLLGTYPAVQEKMYLELIEVLGEDRDVNKDDLRKLVYTKSVIKESLRITRRDSFITTCLPTVPIVLRHIDKEVILKNYTLRANSQCAILILGLHHNAAWGPDADQFKPERWLDPATLPRNANCFSGFSLGKRSCPGMTYAITFLTVVLSHLVRQYRWTADVSKLELKFEITVKPVEAQEITIQRRNIHSLAVLQSE